jgi:mono/diheme cytochrome c family protein
MRTFLAVVAFSLLTIGLFAGYSRFGIPQIEPAPPPEAEELELGAMSMEQFVALGGRIFEGRGTCTLCHNAVGGRAPLLDDAAIVAQDRLADESYQGKATDVAGYLYESMAEPSAYVVAGFGKEVMAVVAYLQDIAGLEVTVEIPSEPVEEEVAAAPGEPRAPLTAPEDAIAEFACGGCHKIAGEEGELGPDLTSIGAQKDRDYLRRAILDPNVEIAEGYDPEMMPEDYGEQLYAVELEMLVDYLAGLK